MSELHPTVEERLAQITEEVQFLRSTVEDLVRRVGAPLESLAGEDREPGGETAPDTDVSLQRATGDALSSAATICFVLVAALLLRTVADNGIVPRLAGIVMGVVYSLVLIGISERRYSKAQRQANIFSVCGALSLLSIVYEGHMRFEALSGPISYAVLAGVVLLALYQGLRHRALAPLSVGLLGASVIGLLLDFPDPVFASPGALLLLAGAASVQANRLPSGRWIKWVSLGLILLFWCFWVIKLRVPLLRGAAPASSLSFSWFFPCLAAYVAVYTAIAARAHSSKTGLHRTFESILPVCCAVGAYWAARPILMPWVGSLRNIGLFGVLWAAAYTVQAIQFAVQSRRSLKSSTAFIVGAASLWMLSLPETGLSRTAVIFLWAVSAVGLMGLARKWRDHGIALLAGVVQAVACVKAYSWEVLPLRLPLLPSTVGTAFALSLICIVLYVESRSVRRGRVKILGVRMDPSRRAAVFFLIEAVVCGFIAVRILLLAALAALHYQEGDVVLCAQSILLNAFALLIAVAGLMSGVGEVLAVALLVAMVGAAKVFGNDLFQARDLPLILSVLSFGVTAALGSTIWARWQRRKN